MIHLFTNTTAIVTRFCFSCSRAGAQSYKRLLFLIVIPLLTMQARAQVKIGNNSNTINPNSLLELESTSKGLLLPRVALTGITSASPLTAHVQGMVVYNTDTAGTAPNQVLPGYYFNDGTVWRLLSDPRTQPWFNQATKTAATANTQDVYLMGKVGIETEAPLHSLQVAENIGLSADPRFPFILLNPTSGAGTRQGKVVMDGVSDYLILQGADRSRDGAKGGSARNILQVHAGAPNTSLLISEAGSVGINNASPAEKLDVNGRIKAVSVLTTSDRRLKTDIRPVAHAGTLVNKLNPVHYLKSSPGSGEESHHEYGFIAQEIKKLLPELVSGTETDSTYLSMDYLSLIAILTKALQEQQGELAILKDQVAHLAALGDRSEDSPSRLDTEDATQESDVASKK